jgi:hypothetical protein
MTALVAVRRGSLYLPRDIYDRYFLGLRAAALQRRGQDLAILPVRQAEAGGYLLKQRNARGDRVVSAPDFFRSHGLDHDLDREAAVCWDAPAATLVAVGVFRDDQAG